MSAPRRRLWVYASIAFASLIGLSVAAWLLFTGQESVTDDLIIVTIPSGAEVEFDGIPLGPAPVKLDRIRLGVHRLRIRKQGFADIDEPIDVGVDGESLLQFSLKPLAPAGSTARTPAEQIDEFGSLAVRAIERGVLVEPYLESALYYADAILAIDAANAEAVGIREDIRKRLVSSGRQALGRRDYSRARSVFEQLLRAFPDDPDGRAGLEAARDPGRRPATRPKQP